MAVPKALSIALRVALFCARGAALSVTQALLGKRRRNALLQLSIVSSRAVPVLSSVPIVSGALGNFASPLLGLWTYGVSARLLVPAHWRSLQFWRLVLPIYCGYKKTQLALAFRKKSQAERDKRWSKRHQWGAEKVYHLCVTLRGFYLKDGQYLGSRTDFIPAAWCERLRSLQDHVPPVPWVEVEASLKKSYRINKVSQLFQHVDTTPLASATIAQIHRGSMQDGTQVVIKTQYADQERLCEMDLRNLKRLAAFLQKHDMNFFDMQAVVDEFDQQIPLEFDFEREAEAMSLIRQNLNRAGLLPDVEIPEVIPGLITRRAITMTFVKGVRPDNTIALKLWGVQPERVAETVGRAVGQMMLVDGFMHCDVHAGNLLVLRDGRVSLIDFGQCKRIPEDLRRKLCKFYLAIYSGRREIIARTFFDLGVELDFEDMKGMDDRDEALNLITMYANGLLDTAPLPPGIEISPFSDESPLKKVPIRKFRSDLFMILRTMGLLRALCDVLDVEVSMSTVFRNFALAGLRIRPPSVLEWRQRAERVRSELAVQSPFRYTRDDGCTIT